MQKTSNSSFFRRERERRKEREAERVLIMQMYWTVQVLEVENDLNTYELYAIIISEFIIFNIME